MKFFKISHDGGQLSGVKGFWLVEIKSLFSIVVLRFSPGSREAFHEHAFNAYTWWLKGEVTEEFVDGTKKNWKPSFKPKFTPRNCFHRIISKNFTYALSIRGPWKDTWREQVRGHAVTLTHGRKIVDSFDGSVV